MKKLVWIILVFPLIANAAYQRNTARAVNDVVFGKVDTVRYITQQEVIQSQSSGWETLLGAAVGGLVGNQFGAGRGKEVATAVGAVVGATGVRSQANKEYRIEHKLVELLIETEKGQLINVIQDVDSSMLFEPGEQIRILYFDDGVRVDKTY